MINVIEYETKILTVFADFHIVISQENINI